jgi:uncharacterized protein (DUF427 family)
MAQALEDTAIRPGEANPERTITFEDTPRRVRVMFGGQLVADSTRV